MRVLSGRATLHRPTQNTPRWQIAFSDPITGIRRTLSARTREEVLDKARAALGDWTDDAPARGRVGAPTVGEAFAAWHRQGAERWSDRTAVVYEYRYRAHLAQLSEMPVTAVAPHDLADVALSVSREQARRVRSIVRGVFDTVERHTHIGGSTYAAAVRLPGTKSDDAPRRVETSQIPTTAWVTSVIDCAWSTCQEHPAHGDVTSAMRAGGAGYEVLSMLPEMTAYTGLPVEVTDRWRRGTPRHYGDLAARHEAETREIASRMRQIALITALGAGGGLRIGEVLALRPRHLYPHLDGATRRQVEASMYTRTPREWLDNKTHPLEQDRGLVLGGYRGRIEVVEQVSPLSTGRMAISKPKGGRERTVWLQPVLYPAHDKTHRRVRDLLVSAVTHDGMTLDYMDPTDTTRPLWDMSMYDALTLWGRGYIPLGLLLHDRLREMWVQAGRDVRRWHDMLLFPTRNPARKRGAGPLFPSRWPHGKDVPFGTFQAPANLSHRYISPLYDYVSETLGTWPGYKGTSRRGYVHHALRHYAISHWLAHGVPLPVVSEQAGHADPAFTLSRYAHAVHSDIQVNGLEA